MRMLEPIYCQKQVKKYKPPLTIIVHKYRRGFLPLSAHTRIFGPVEPRPNRSETTIKNDGEEQLPGLVPRRAPDSLSVSSQLQID